jgi:hypothetical protein
MGERIPLEKPSVPLIEAAANEQVNSAGPEMIEEVKSNCAYAEGDDLVVTEETTIMGTQLRLKKVSLKLNNLDNVFKRVGVAKKHHELKKELTYALIDEFEHPHKRVLYSNSESSGSYCDGRNGDGLNDESDRSPSIVS